MNRIVRGGSWLSPLPLQHKREDNMWSAQVDVCFGF
jgi:hypothetical protein